MTLETLLDDFSGGKSVSFAAFKSVWKRLRFGQVHFLHQLDKSYTLYHHNQRQALLKQRMLTGYKTLLRLAVLPSPARKRIAAVYCLYCIYHTQPAAPKHPVPVTPQTFRILLNLAKADSDTFGSDCCTLQILLSLFDGGAFVFSATDGVLCVVKSWSKVCGDTAEIQPALPPLKDDLLSNIATCLPNLAKDGSALNATTEESSVFVELKPEVDPGFKAISLEKSATPSVASAGKWKPREGVAKLELPGFLLKEKVDSRRRGTRRSGKSKAGHVKKAASTPSKSKPLGVKGSKGREQEQEQQQKHKQKSKQKVQPKSRKKEDKAIAKALDKGDQPSSDDSDLEALENEVFGDMDSVKAGAIVTQKATAPAKAKEMASDMPLADEIGLSEAEEEELTSSLSAAKEMESLLAGKKPATLTHESRPIAQGKAAQPKLSTSSKVLKSKRKAPPKRRQGKRSTGKQLKKAKATKPVESDEEEDLEKSLSLAREMEAMLGPEKQRSERFDQQKPVHLVSKAPATKEKYRTTVARKKPRKRKITQPSSSTGRAPSSANSTKRTRADKPVEASTKDNLSRTPTRLEEGSSDDDILQGSKALADSLNDMLKGGK